MRNRLTRAFVAALVLGAISPPVHAESMNAKEMKGAALSHKWRGGSGVVTRGP